jgi:hypothetical protein
MTETTAIVLRIAKEKASQFEKLFRDEELPIWDDFMGRGLFLEAKLIRVIDGSERREGIQDYILHVVTINHRAHERHDDDPRFKAFLEKAKKMQPADPLVWFGETVFERS